jgi:cytochrome oxidase Cu insertion factor (SCO1/SenC/PrrC family)
MTLRRASLWGLLIAVLLGITFATVRNELEKWRRPSLPRIAALPSFQLQEREGSLLGTADLAGAPWVASFLFTRCPEGCATVAARMADLHGTLATDSPVHLVTLTVDPEHDTAAVLRGFARSWGADRPPSRWWWFTGAPEEILPLVREGFLLGAGPEELSAEGADPASGIVSSGRLVLVDGEGWIRGYYDAANDGEMALLRRDLAGLMASSR